MFREKLLRALQNELITYEEYLLALNTGVLTIQPDPGLAELNQKLRDRLAATKMDPKAYEAVIDDLLKMKHGLTHIAVHIKRMGQMTGATVEVAVAQNANGRFLIAGLNSSARWTTEQRDELNRLGIKIAPQKRWKPDSKVEGKKNKLPHAEENILFELARLLANAIKFSNAPVGQGKPDSDVCANCRRLIRGVGASIEPDMHEKSPAPRRPGVESAPAPATDAPAPAPKLWGNLPPPFTSGAALQSPDVDSPDAGE